MVIDLPSVDEIDKQLAEASLSDFIQQSWPVIEPGTEYLHNWHIDAICEFLQGVDSGQITRLLINMPPRMMKSIAVSVMWPVWSWIHKPQSRWMFASYAGNLSTQHSVDRRTIIQSDWYQERWADKYQLTSDQNVKTEYQNNHQGRMFATSFKGVATGKGGNRLVFDDPQDPTGVESEKQRETSTNTFRRKLSTRLNNKKIDAIVVVSQRLGEKDISAVCIEQEYTHLNLPAEDTPGKVISAPSGKTFTRDESGLLWPEREGPKEIAQAKIQLGPWGYCTPGYTPILMANWSEKPISEIEIGDEVIGYEFGSGTKKTFLVPAKVHAISRSIKQVLEITLSSGRKVHCTEDHRWYSRLRSPGTPEYVRARVGSRLCSVYKPTNEVSRDDQRLYDWIGGILDGEGTCHERGSIWISQSDRNPEVQGEIERSLKAIGIDFGFWSGPRRNEKNPKWAQRGAYWLRGGRSVKIEILRHCHMAKRQRFIDSLWASCGSLPEKLSKGLDTDHKVISIEPIGEMMVYGLTTTTGNYVAWGFASQNSGQYQQAPAPQGGGRFKSAWFRYYTRTPDNEYRLTRGSKTWQVKDDDCWRFAVMDPAGTDPEQNKKACYTAILVWAVAPSGDMILLHVYREQVETPEVADAAVRICRQWELEWIGIEKDGIGLGVVQHVRAKGVSVRAIKARGSKEARSDVAEIRMSAGMIHFPAGAPFLFELEKELLSFPAGEFKDQADALSHSARVVQQKMLPPTNTEDAVHDTNVAEREEAEKHEGGSVSVEDAELVHAVDRADDEEDADWMTGK